jgi:tRNA threonylcarbamoyl adenosine modification protein (Sua5/YciO/YrdC/YwlC family)
LVVFGTDSAYAVGTDAFSATGTAALRKAKGRPEAVKGAAAQLPVLVANPGVVDALTYNLPTTGRDLIEALWPGPLTLIARQQPSLAWNITDGVKVSVRMPLHPVALELLTAAGPIAATGANFAGMPVPMTCSDATAQLGDAVAVYLDCGDMFTEHASAVIDVTTDPPLVLRPGAVGMARLTGICPRLVAAE